MTEHSTTLESSRAMRRVGQRVSRKETEELGTIIEIDGKIKMKWDGGRTSHFRHGDAANVELKRRTEQAGTFPPDGCYRDEVTPFPLWR